MAFLKVFMFVLISSLSYTRGDLVEELSKNKCTLSDKKCLGNMFQTALKLLSQGEPKLGIPPIDPMNVKNFKASFENILDITFVEGTVKGAKDCVVDEFSVDTERLHVSIEITCNLTIKGKYEVSSPKTGGLRALVPEEVTGNGNGKIKLEQATLKLKFPFEIVKRGDDYFFTAELKNFKYSFKVHKRVTFAADNLYVGQKESSKELVRIINDNWPVIVETLGQPLLKLILEFVHPFLHSFFDKVETRYYIIDDLSKYVK